MGLTEGYTTGRPATVAPDAVTGVIHQDGKSPNNSQDRTTAGSITFGVPIAMAGTVGLAADGTHTLYFFNANAPAKYRVIDAQYIMRSHRTGGSPAHTIQLFNGSNAISDAADCDAAAQGVVNKQYNFGTLDDAYEDIAAGGTLKVVLTLSGTTTTGATLGDVIVWVIPVGY